MKSLESLFIYMGLPLKKVLLMVNRLDQWQKNKKKKIQSPKSDNNKTSPIICLFLDLSTFSKFVKYFGVLDFGILPVILI